MQNRLGVCTLSNNYIQPTSMYRLRIAHVKFSEIDLDSSWAMPHITVSTKSTHPSMLFRCSFSNLISIPTSLNCWQACNMSETFLPNRDIDLLRKRKEQ